MSQFSKFLANEATTGKKKFFDSKVQSVLRTCNFKSDLYFKDFKVHENYPAFSTLLKIIFTLSHGQISVERGFSDNNVLLKDNSNVSVIARRFLKNCMRVNNVEPPDMQISRELLKSVKASRQRYQIYLEDQRKESKKKEKSNELIQVENELKTINSECTTLEKVISTFNTEIFEKLKSASKTTSNELRCKMVVVEIDALKRKCDEKEDQLVVLRKRAKQL